MLMVMFIGNDDDNDGGDVSYGYDDIGNDGGYIGSDYGRGNADDNGYGIDDDGHLVAFFSLSECAIGTNAEIVQCSEVFEGFVIGRS